MTDEDFKDFIKKLGKFSNNSTSVPYLCEDKFQEFIANYSDTLEVM